MVHRIRLLIPIIIVLVIIGLLSLWQYTRQKAEEDVYTGTIEAESSMVGSTVGGRVSRTLVEEGDTVSRGDRIVVFESEQWEANLRVAMAERQQAAARLNELLAGPREEEVERARAAYNAARSERILAERSYERLRNLYEEGAVAAQTLDEARARLQTTRAQERAAREQLNELLAGTRPERIAEARAALRQAEARVEQIRADVRERAVFAPRSGQVQTLNVQVGDIVQPGQPVATIVDPTDLYIRIYVPAGELGDLRVGSELPVVTDSGIRVTGVVEQIPVEAEFTPRNVQTREERALQVYAVKIRVPNPEMKIRAGMSADVRLK